MKTETPLPNKRPDGLPRRIDLTLMTPSERAIHHAIRLIETDLGADPLLTQAQMLLSEAKDKVSDWLEGGTGL